MMYDLIEVTPKKNWKKILIIVSVIVLVLILLFVLFFIKNNNIFIGNTVENTTNTIEEKQNIVADDNKEKTKHVAYVSMVPSYTDTGKNLMNNIYGSQEKVAYLTFDDGPSKSVTPLVLDLLKQENIKATFFVLGSRVELNQDTIRRMYKEGHYIANHGYSHIYGNIYSNPEAVLDEYNKTTDAIKQALGIDYDGHLFRFPGGSSGGKYNSVKKEAKTLLADNNIAYIDWNALNSDAAGAKTKEAIIESTKQTVGSKNSVIILMHDAGDKILTYESLPEIIAYLREQGYTFKNFYSIIK